MSPQTRNTNLNPPHVLEVRAGGWGVLEPKKSVSRKMAQINISFCKISSCPNMKSGSGAGGTSFDGMSNTSLPLGVGWGGGGGGSGPTRNPPPVAVADWFFFGGGGGGQGARRG